MDEVSEIKERLDIVEIVSSYLTLKKAGTNFKAACPFHHEKTPSFMVSPERQTFKCFGCNEGGDIFTFIEKMEGVDFFNALKLLADRAGIQLKRQSIKYGDREYKSDLKTRLFEINDWAKKLYHKILTDHPKAEKARKYLRGRGLSKETIKEFELGYAPDSWELLIKFLEKRDYKPEEAVRAGLAVRSAKDSIYDRFRGRIVFPINNIMGSTIAFTSRLLIENPKEAKYINSAESPIYTKGKTIYGLDKAKVAIRENNMAIFVEGNMDVIACHQAGFKNVVATSGTAITEDQLKTLSRYAETTAFSFDSDEAGYAAMKKAIRLSLKNDIATKIIFLPGPYKDPDEAIQSDPKNFKRAIETAKPSLEHWIDLLISGNPTLDVLTKKRIAKEILPVIKTIYSDIEKEYYIKYLAKRLFVSEKALISALDKSTSDREAVSQGQNNQNLEKKLSLEEKIAGFIWMRPELLNLAENLKLNLENLPRFSQMIQSKQIKKEGLRKEEREILGQYEMLILKDYDFSDLEAIKNEFLFLTGLSKKDKKEHIKADFAHKIQAAEEKGDKKLLQDLLREFSGLIK